MEKKAGRALVNERQLGGNELERAAFAESC